MSSERSFFRDVLLASLLGLGIVAGINFVVDPFHMNRVFELPLIKERMAPLYNSRLYKLVAYTQAPSDRLILGDSRCEKLRAEYFDAAGAPGYLNMSFGGATLWEILEAFWYAQKRMPLRSVVLCIPFSLFDEANRRTTFGDAAELLEHPAAYYLSPLVLRVSGALLVERATGIMLRTDRPDMTEDEFWQSQLGPNVAGAYRFWREPKELRAKLEEVVAFSARNGISLLLVAPPNHVDLQRKVDDYGLRDAYTRYKEYLAGLAPFLDLDQENALTETRANFIDPFHLNDDAARAVTRGVASEIPERAAARPAP